MPQQRPRLCKTIKDLRDFLAQAVANGDLRDSDFLYMTVGTDLHHPTFCFFNADGGRPFVTIDYWTDTELDASAVRNDVLGTPDHFIS